MNIIEVKNNLVKLSYDEDIILSSFIKITDLKNSYIAQILHLEASRIGKTAIAKIIFNFKCGIQAYDGSIPSIQAEVEVLDDEFLLNTLEKNEPLFMGKLAQRNSEVVVSSKLLMDRPVICAEKSYQYSQLVKNIVKQNEENSKKTVVIDITGEINGNKITATEDFKIPLDKNSIDYIFDRGFDDLTKENKAFIQDIFSELNDYIKTVKYIPFNDFNAVIDYEFKRTQQLQLIILKNRLTQFEKSGIFAQNENEFEILQNKLKSDNTLIIDISKLSAPLQTEYINYIFDTVNAINANFYTFVSLNNNNSTVETLKKVLGCKNVFPLIACPYSYKYLTELKQCSKNMFMFTPIKQQADFGAYNIYLNKLAEDEFILYGKSTKFIPLIMKLEEIEVSEYQHPAEETAITSNNYLSTIQENNNSEIYVSDVPKENTEIEFVTEPEDIIIEEVNTDELQQEVENQPIDDNDEIEEYTPIINDNIEIVEEITAAPIDTDEETVIVTTTEDELENIEEVEDIEDIENIEEEISSQETEENQNTDENVEKEKIKKEVDDDISEINYEAELKAQLADINISDNEIADIVAQTKGNEIIKGVNDNIGEEISNEDEIKQSLNPSDLFKAQDDNTEMNEEHSDEDLTDEDLDMIDALGADKFENSENFEESEIQEEIEIIENTQDKPEVQENEQSQEKKISITDEILQEEAERKIQEEAQKVDPVEEMIEKPTDIPKPQQKAKALETKETHTPIVPVYSAEIPDEDIVESDTVKQGDRIEHPEFGRGIVEKIINYGDRTLCSVNFEQVGRRLLDPKISELKKL